MDTLKKFFVSALYRRFPPPMVSYWKTKEAVAAKITRAKEGHLIMCLEGEKYPFPGFPRGYVLSTSLSPLKHEIKNRVFNQSWALLPDKEAIARNVKEKLLEIVDFAKASRTDMVPFEKLAPAVKEIWRAWTKIEGNDPRVRAIKEILTFILQEDDGYRFRVQYLAGFFNPNSWWQRKIPIIKQFEYAFSILEHAEVIGDMKERIKLLRTILLIALEDPYINTMFKKFAAELDWKKIRLSKADKYYFRGKYFKVDYPYWEY